MLGNEYQKDGPPMYENKDTGVAVFKGRSQSTQQLVVIKEQTFRSLEDVNFALTEAMMQTRLDHENICKIYDARIGRHGDGFSFSIVIEYMQRGDLSKDIANRKEHGYGWTDDQLLSCLDQLSSALAYAETRGVAHRDIKPQNIFVADNGTLKIGDFGSSSNNALKKMQNTIMGSPYYLSPEIRRQYLQSMLPSSYDPFKSDVFSLGVTICYMALLEPDMSLLSAADPSHVVNTVLGRISHYPKTQQCVIAMLNLDPANRVSFADLNAMVKQFLQTPVTQSAPTIASTTMSNPAPAENHTLKAASIPAARPARIAKPCAICNNPVASDNAWNQYIRSQNQQFSTQFPLICSEQCYNEACRRMSQMCCICGRSGFPPLQVANPEQYQNFLPYFNFLCSESCLATFIYWSQDPNGHPKCAYCQAEIYPLTQTLNSTYAVMLECKHCFHNPQCLLKYLAVASNNFHKSDVQYQCPICKSEISQNFIESNGSRYPQFMSAMQVLYNESCSCCGTLENLQTPQCEHPMCQSCGNQLNWVCPFHATTY